jgi:hypothetical protein
MAALAMPEEIYSELIDHLADDEIEHVAFLFTAPPTDDHILRVKEIFRVPSESFDHQSSYHVALTDDVRGAVIKRAWDLGGCLVEVHSHGGGAPVWFSGSDLSGFKDWVPHVRWRLAGRTYVALVFAGIDFDALVWEGEAPTPLAELNVDGRAPQIPSGITSAKLARQR